MAKRRDLSPLPSLAGDQALASEPRRQVRLSASAGTGKTQVLSARVLRLLLKGVAPESILCITFTKAGAAEMADRIHERLGAWVTMKQTELATDLIHLGEDHSPDACENARSLFARVLDARGSGLRIQTIHSFCQTLLAGFPAEAGLTPGFRPIEGREEDQLQQRALGDMVAGFVREGRAGDLERLRALAKRLSEDATRKLLKRCALHPDALEVLPADAGIGAFVRRTLADGIDDIQGWLEARCSDDVIPELTLERLIAANLGWATATGTKSASAIRAWLDSNVADRVMGLDVLPRAWLKLDGTLPEKRPKRDGYADDALAMAEWCQALLEKKRARAVSEPIANALIVGRAYARAYADAKAAAGVVDFNDLIRKSVALLQSPGIGDWVRFKLDQSVDHILVDEAQDTNADQWAIVKALAEEFFSGEGAKPGVHRTVFTVGDFKQAIFGFQGTDPRAFEEAGRYFAAQAENGEQEMLRLALSHSFRSSPPILDVTDAVLADLGWDALGLVEAPEQHQSSTKGKSGTVMLLPPVTGVADAEGDDDQGEEDWLAPSELVWAKQLAERIRSMTTGGLRLRNQDRDAQPGDVMVLVRSRGELARLIVSRLYEAGVPVAGVDRLRLGAPIAVKDLLACIRFVLQPRDDLSLAALLVSPLVGWSQEQLYAHAAHRKGDLWSHLKKRLDDTELRVPNALLAMADLSTPYRFLEAVLSGPIRGCRKLIARLGEEARDPIEALISAALDFEQVATPSLQLFLDWFDRGDVEIKRDPSKPENAVRVMTVHGAKGLQAPIVILADATGDPDFKSSRELDWVVDGLRLPLFRPAKADRVASLAQSADAQDQREREEHWRLLYVAMTRAEEHLIVGGALKPKQIKQGMGDACWHVRIGQALIGLDAARLDDGSITHAREDAPKSGRAAEAPVERWTGDLPAWSLTPARPEARPPRPLSPSALGVPDREADPPPTPELRKAARRGVLLHSLFERLPAVAPDQRAGVAFGWLEHAGGVEDATQRQELLAAALGVIENPRFAGFFGSDALAEAPLAGVVDGHVVAGTVDRLVVSDDSVTVVDFKTGRRVPRDVAAIPPYHIAQMAAYAAVLQGIFPGRRIDAALLYTSGPILHALPADLLEAHKPGFSDMQIVLAKPG